MAGETDLDTRAATLAETYSLDVNRVRSALLQAEEFRFWRFRHHGVMKTEDALAAEIASAPGAENCQWLLRPSLEEALALPRIAPSESLDLFLNAKPWEVRQRRQLLLGFVPFSDAPFYTLDEFADELDGFAMNQNSDALYLIEMGTMVAKPGGEGWARRELGALYPDWPGLTPMCPRHREAVLMWRANFIQSHLVPGIRAAAKQGDRGNRRAASRFWEASRSHLRDLLNGVKHQDILQREIESIMRQTCIGLGPVTRMALLAAHCSAEIAFGSHRKTRNALGLLVGLDDIHRPHLMLELYEPLGGYNTLFKQDAGSDGERVARAVSLHSRCSGDEVALWKKQIAEIISDLQGMAQTAGRGGMKDKDAQAKAREVLVKHVLLSYKGNKAKMAEALGLVLADRTKPLEIPEDIKLDWQDVTLRLERDDMLTLRVKKDQLDKDQLDVEHTWRFPALTFKDKRCPDEDRPTDRWLMFAGILRHAYSDASRQQDRRFQPKHFHLSLGNGEKAKKARDVESQLLVKVRRKLKELTGIGKSPFVSRKDMHYEHTYEVLFRVAEPSGEAKSSAIWVPKDLRSED